MTVLQDVRDYLVGHKPRPYCDDCLADELNLTRRQHANHKTRELAMTFGFQRHLGECTICKGRKKVISYSAV